MDQEKGLLGQRNRFEEWLDGNSWLAVGRNGGCGNMKFPLIIQAGHPSQGSPGSPSPSLSPQASQSDSSHQRTSQTPILRSPGHDQVIRPTRWFTELRSMTLPQTVINIDLHTHQCLLQAPITPNDSTPAPQYSSFLIPTASTLWIPHRLSCHWPQPPQHEPHSPASDHTLAFPTSGRTSPQRWSPGL